MVSPAQRARYVLGEPFFFFGLVRLCRSRLGLVHVANGSRKEPGRDGFVYSNSTLSTRLIVLSLPAVHRSPTEYTTGITDKSPFSIAL